MRSTSKRSKTIFTICVISIIIFSHQFYYDSNYIEEDIPIDVTTLQNEFNQIYLQRLFESTIGTNLENPIFNNNLQLDISINNTIDKVPLGTYEDTSESYEEKRLLPENYFQDLVDIAKNALPRTLGKNTSKEYDSIAHHLGVQVNSSFTRFEKFVFGINKDEVYSEENYHIVEDLLKEMATAKVVGIRQAKLGTQFKLIIKLEGGATALMKPLRVSRYQQTGKNQFYFTDFERYNAEIGGFHLDRLLGFRRSLPVVGRVLNISSELYPFADGRLLQTFFVSAAGNMCFHGSCKVYCESEFSVCGSPDALESSMIVFMPIDTFTPLIKVRSKWRRSYQNRDKAPWEGGGKEYCDLVMRQNPTYKNTRRLLDQTDLAVFDFLTGNMDRHHLIYFEAFGKGSFPIHLDNGLGFGQAFHDEMSILAPLYQCCLIRHSTVLTLAKFNNGPERLSAAMRKSLNSDPLAPEVLWEPNLLALDRRVIKILQTVRVCVEKAKDPLQVIINDLH